MVRHRLLSFAIAGLVVVLPGRLTAQDTPTVPPKPRCYRLALGWWSTPLGTNAAYHAVPPLVQLTATPALHGGWRVAPDIKFPTGRDFPGAPRWMQRGDSIDILWSNGFQATRVRLGPGRGSELRGMATVQSDANEFGIRVPHASVTASPVSCAALRATK